MGVSLEIKARALDVERQRKIAASMSDAPCQRIDQVDTFFGVAEGLLKLREFAPARGELIHYDSTVSSGPRTSRHSIVATQDPAALRELLSHAHRVLGTVRKSRYLYLVGQTRIHFDDVEGLGWHIEIETVLEPGQTEEDGRSKTIEMMKKLDISEADLIEGTYFDLLNSGHQGDQAKGPDHAVATDDEKRHYRQVVEMIPHGVGEIDRSGVVLFANQAWHDLFGYEYGELLGTNILDLVESDSNREEVREYLAFLVREQPQPTSQYSKLRRKDGRVVEIQVHWSYKRDERERVIGFISVITDVTQHRVIEGALRQTERQYHDMFNALGDAVLVTDLDLNIVDVNPAACAMYGYRRDEFIGKSGKIVIHERDRHVIPLGTQAIQTGKPVLLEHASQKRDGTVFDVEVLLSPIEHQGKPHILAAIRDITERKKAEEEMRETSTAMKQMIEEQNALLEHTRDFVYRHDCDGIFNYLSPAVEQITGYRVDQWWKHYTTYMTDHPVNQEVEEHTETALRTGKEGPPYLVEIKHGDGHHVMLEVNERPYFEDGKVAGIIGVARDVTERTQAEVELNKAKNSAEMANRSKSAFLANISHEIHTPMMAIMTAAERLKRQEKRSDDTYTDTIIRNGQHLVSLFDDLLDASRMEAGKLPVAQARCSLVEIMTDVQTMLSLHVQEQVEFQLAFTSRIPRAIKTDARRVRQAVLNLVGNALKFTNTGHVHVSVSVDAKKEDPRLAIVVEDTGIGISQEAMDLIFEPFGQVDGGQIGLTKGVGLGLAITRWIAEELGGCIDVRSVEGEGSTFTLRICTGSLDGVEWLEPSDLQTEMVSARRDSDRHTYGLDGHILLAEDSDDVRELLVEALADAGANVTAVGNGQEAVDVCKEHPFDLILLDLNMPGMDGLTAAAEIRRQGCLAAMIAVTAWSEPGEQKRVLAAGFDDVWPKPVSVEHVVRQAAAYLNAQPDCESDAQERSRIESLQVRLEKTRSDFVATLTKRTSDIRGAVDASDGSRCVDVLHQLVGSAGICGFAEVSCEAARLLSLARGGALLSPGDELIKLEKLVASIVAKSAS